jgi:hypothetical protein
MSPPPTEILDRIASVLHHELMVPSPPMMSPSGHYIRTLRDALLQDGKKWRVFEEMLITVGPDDYDDVSVDELPEDLTWFGWDFSFVKRPTEIDDEDSTASKTDHKSIYKIFNAPVTSPETLYVLVPPDFEKGDLLTFLESIFEGEKRQFKINSLFNSNTNTSAVPMFPLSQTRLMFCCINFTILIVQRLAFLESLLFLLSKYCCSSTTTFPCSRSPI